MIQNVETVVECSGIVKRYEDLTAVAGVDLFIKKGECFGLLGPNGAGKTTTVEMFEGLLKPDEGNISICGIHWGRGEDHRIRELMGVQLQEAQLLEKITVFETLQLFRSFFKKGLEPREVMKQVSLQEKENARVAGLSGGQRQRLAIACALVGSPQVLFLDEPTTGLDPQARKQLWHVVESFKSQGGTVLLTTHYMEEAEKLCDRLAIMDHGKIIAEGSPQQLIGSLGADQIIQFTLESKWENELFSSLPGVKTVHNIGHSITLSTSEIGATLSALFSQLETKNAKLATLSTHQASLEDVFMNLTGRTLIDE